jgi:hypothetical protein
MNDVLVIFFPFSLILCSWMIFCPFQRHVLIKKTKMIDDQHIVSMKKQTTRAIDKNKYNTCQSIRRYSKLSALRLLLSFILFQLFTNSS